MNAFSIGSEVRVRNGRLGRLAQVVLDRHTGEVSDLVVNLQGGGVQVVLPASLVVQSNQTGVTLDMDLEDLDNLRVFRPTEFEACELPVEGIPEGGALYWLRRYGDVTRSRPALAGVVTRQWARSWPESRGAVGRGTPVHLGDESVGSVDHVLLDVDTGEITHLVVNPEDDPEVAVIVPADQVAAAREGELELDLPSDEWAILTRYSRRPDEAIIDEVRGRLAEVGCPIADLTVSVERGVVAIEGPAYDLDTKRAADEAVREVEGVVGVENYLSIDSAVAADITSALARDPRTYLRAINVSVLRGTVTLTGVVAETGESEAAESIARGTPGAQAVMNELEVDSRLRPAPEGLLVLHPSQVRQQGL